MQHPETTLLDSIVESLFLKVNGKALLSEEMYIKVQPLLVPKASLKAEQDIYRKSLTHANDKLS